MNPAGRSSVYSAMETQLALEREQMLDAQFEIDVLELEVAFVDTDDGLDRDADVSALDRQFTDFYERSYTVIVRALTCTLRDREFAREAVDEAMLRAYARWDKVHAYDNPAGWVYRVALNWARSLHRRLARRLPWVDRPEVADPPVADPAVHAALRALDVDLRAVVVCRLLLDWSIEDTAIALHVKPGTVKSRLHRALGQLDRALRDERN